MILQFFKGEFSVCRLRDLSGLEASRDMFFFAKTREELSLVCASADAPEGAERVEGGWRMFRVEGQLDFSLVGILAGITAVLAAAGVGVFVVSTFDTDYVMVKAAVMDEAIAALRGGGYEVEC